MTYYSIFVLCSLVCLFFYIIIFYFNDFDWCIKIFNIYLKAILFYFLINIKDDFKKVEMNNAQVNDVSMRRIQSFKKILF